MTDRYGNNDVEAKGFQEHIVIIIPEPVGPIKRTLLFSSSTLSSLSIPSGIPDSAPNLVLKPSSRMILLGSAKKESK